MGILFAAEQTSRVADIAGLLIYGAQAAVALWGAFCLILVWMRVTRQRFASEAIQNEFLGKVDEALAARDFDAVVQHSQDDARTLSQLVYLAIRNRHLGYSRARQLTIDHFQRDVLADIEYRLSWVTTVIKTAPMLGLLGTVVGMMAAFGKIAADDSVGANALAKDISLALITTVVGLSIAIPLMLAINSVRARVRKMEDSVETGLARFLEMLRGAL
ncbi:MAG: MotA/TolQ/ExbB proton channel family protein [Pirellulales bacterium]